MGWCAVCDGDIIDEDDCIEGTWFHACPENLLMMEPKVGIVFVVSGVLW